MNTSKLFIALGSVTMAVAGIFATKPAKKFAAPAQIYAGGAYNSVLAVISSSSHLTTVKGTLHTAFFKTVSGSAVTLLTASGQFSKVVYFKP